MAPARWLRAGLAAAWLVFAAYALWGLPGVPFHPDESTYLYMSRDFDLLFKQANPAALGWQAADQPADVLRYRLLDAPLAHALPGLGRLLAGYASAPAHDWNWSLDWAANAALGSLPSAGELAVARGPAAVLTVLSVLPLYGIGLRLGGLASAIGAALLYALSGLLLLHGRRAMSEGPLLFFTLAAVWLVLFRPRQTWAWGVAAALALAAKLTALGLLPVLAVAALWQPPAAAGAPTPPTARGWLGARARPAVLCAASFAAACFLLSPALWSQPVGGLSAMLWARQELSADVTGALSATAPAQVSSTLGERLFAMLYHVYFAPPAFWDVPNYAEQTAAAEQRYLAAPLRTGWHTRSLSFNLAAGGALLALTLAGVGFGLHDLAAGLANRSAAALAPAERNALIVLLVWSAGTVLALLPINIAWQRYYLPLLPIVCLWSCYGAMKIMAPFAWAARRRRAGR